MKSSSSSRVASKGVKSSEESLRDEIISDQFVSASMGSLKERFDKPVTGEARIRA